MEFNPNSAESQYRAESRSIREQPPRQINSFTKLTVIFGGLLQQMGWAFFGFGMIFFWVFVMNSEARYLLAFDGKWVETQGVLREVVATSSEVNDRRIYAYNFTYFVGGKQMEGSSYGTMNGSYQPNTPVQVQYKSGNPKRVRLQGLSSSVFPVWVIFVVIFPAIGLALLISGLLSNLKALNLLVNGHFTKGKIVNKEATGTRVNNNTVYKYTFAFEVNGQRQEANCSTYQTWKVEDEAMEIILYDAQNPKHAIVFDAVSGAPQLDPSGHFEPAPLSSASTFILPIIAIGLNALLFYLFVVLDIM